MSEPYRSPAAEDECDPLPDDRKPFGYGRDRCPICGQWRPTLSVELAERRPPDYGTERRPSLAVRHNSSFFFWTNHCNGRWDTKLYEERLASEPPQPLGARLVALIGPVLMITMLVSCLVYVATVLMFIGGYL